ncbi:Ig-like domain-containing protein [Candidatus Albibeggiatoa sp. nov. NOAA]|uniref:beta strand repeat-containing protein n=1 Tax=Candidatus Albibeggiatoa sp. nov. NOAA TaxID=3162724 RepID=UPI0033402695
MMLSILAACGGGSAGDEPSALLSNPGNTGGGTGTTDTTETTDVIFFINSAQVIPTAGSSIVTITVFENNPDAQTTDANGNSFTDITRLVTENDVPLRVSVTGDGYFLENGRNFLDITSDQRGQVSFTVAHTGNGNELLTVQGRANYQGGGTTSLYFGGSVVAEIVNNNTEIPADGSSSAQILVSARDASLSPISGLSVDLSFSPDSQASAASETAFLTDVNGQFRANISNAVEQAVSVIPYAGGGRGNTIKLNFTKAAETSTVVRATLVNQGVIPADGETAARVIVSARSSEGTALSGLPVSLSFPADSFAVASPASGSTNESGQFTTNITNLVTQSTTVTPIVGGISADPITLNFGTTAQDANVLVTATLLTQGSIPANGTTTAKLLVLARDLDGVPVEGVPVALAFPKNSFAVATTSIGSTDANGQFQTEISDTVPESVSITAIAGGVSSNPVVIEFIASGGGEQPTRLDIQVVDSTALANGSDTAQVVIVARDNLGNVVPNIPVKLNGGTANSVLRISGQDTVGTLYISGNTGEQGLTVTISNSAEETLNLTATTVTSDTELTSDEQAIRFTSATAAVSGITLEATPAETIANGQSSITLQGRALGANDQPLSNVPVSFEYRGNPVISTDNNGRTYADGRFFATVTNTNVESFSIRAIVEGTSSTPVILTFTNQSGSDGTAVTPGTPPSSVNIIPSTQSVPADGESKLILTVVVLDNNRTPMEDVQVSLSTTAGTASNTALFNQARSTTEASGSATFEVTNTVAGSVTITATAQSLDSDGNASGNAASSNVTVTFVDALASQLTLVSSPSSAAADGTSAINVDVIARNSSGVTVSGVPISMILGDETARATPSTGETNDNGVFTTAITSSQVGTLQVTAQVQGQDLSENLNLQFTSTSGSSDVTKLVISQFSDSEQLANGDDEVTIQVSALDDQGTPVPNVAIELITSADFPVAFSSLRGATGNDGIFSTTVTSIEVGVVSVTAQAPDTNNIRSETLAVTFNASNTNATPSTIELTVENNNQPADNAAQVILVARVLDERGQPVANAPVDLVSNNPAIEPADGNTNGLGEWRTTLTSEIATSVTITAVTTSGNSTKQSTPQTVTFVEVAQVVPASLTLNTATTTADVNGDIEIIASAIDANGTPMANVSITFEIISGAGIFRDAASGSTSEGGTFTANVSSTNAGIVEIRATAAGRAITSNTIALTFEPTTDTQVPVASLALFSSSQTLDSEGTADGIIISVRVKDANNNVLVGKNVNFSADSGAIQPVTRQVADGGTVQYVVAGATDGLTDTTGQAYARLTTVGEPENRTITVNATSETQSGTIAVDVAGTTITIIGTDSVILNNQVQFTITLQDSAGNGIPNRNIQLNSANGNIFDPSSGITNSAGQLTTTLTASQAGQDSITATAGSMATDGTLALSVSSDSFSLTTTNNAREIPIDIQAGSGTANECIPPLVGCDPATDNQDSLVTFTVTWLQANVPQVGQTINVATTRGTAIPSSGVTNNEGVFEFVMTSESAGPAIVTASSTLEGGPSEQLEIEFVATQASTLALQVEPSTIGVNSQANITNGTPTETSEIIAIVRDARNNLVKGKRVIFTLTDVSGGQLEFGAATTDSFGRATTTYISGTAPSGSDGVRVEAYVEDTSSVRDEVFLTVALKQVFISIGTGNTIIEREDNTTYSYPYSALVTDINGAPVKDVEVVVSIVPIAYFKGFWRYVEDAWEQVVTLQCIAEDINRNAILDTGEDFNNNNQLDPRNIVTFEAGDNSVVEGNTVKVKTDKDGFADFSILYAQIYARWAQVELTARTSVEGSEAEDSINIVLDIAAADVNSENVSPPGVISPFGSETPLEAQAEEAAQGVPIRCAN